MHVFIDKINLNDEFEELSGNISHEALSFPISPLASDDVKAVWESREGACMEC
ncbi:hypothetical protein NQZ68_031321 [Dissostichus eleginoides]|nr:hypothetical protein NQZ68_031321 [Dissostichus eleginoides]